MRVFHSVLYILFFFSGCAALIYQVIWQRMLFTLFGLDLQSITIIVSVFMFGLGIGGLLGGVISDQVRIRLLSLYIVIELSIAIFGFLSPTIIAALGVVASGENEVVMGLVSFIILAFPTILMGATFPILVTYVNSYDKSIGKAVGTLYFANTLGGALGVLLSGFFLLNIMGLIGVINVAAFLNFMVAIIAFLMFRRRN